MTETLTSPEPHSAGSRRARRRSAPAGRRAAAIAAAAAIALTACDGADDAAVDAGQPGTDPDSGAPGEGAPDAADAAPDAGPSDTAAAVALGADEGVGVVSEVGVPSLTVRDDVASGAADGDSVSRRIDDEIYILGRAQDNLTILSAGDYDLVGQYGLGGGANPHDVVRAGDSIYVSIYGGAGVAVLDAGDPGAGVVDTIDLSDLEPDTEEPNCSALALAGDRVIAACQRLGDDFAPVGEGAAVAIDTGNHSTEDVLLARENPFSRFAETREDGPLGGDLLIASVGAFDSEIGGFDPDEGCVERVDISGDPITSECLIEHADLDGYVSRIEVDGDDVAWLAVSAGADSFVIPYDLDAEELGERVTPEGQSPSDFALCPSGELVVADTPPGGAQGLRVYDGEDELTEGILEIELPPVLSDGLLCGPL